ncbi:matrix metalloproteinase-18-like [Bufo gargarizans]|uniref:matrix metalloproteinase-18-like n=1 Tax=Bufo gargarizans TaxID=30331 RepID=UPI001CF2CA3C|nr:matrix metalloproteinase-18-like [Bufo gargarizans]
MGKRGTLPDKAAAAGGVRTPVTSQETFITTKPVASIETAITTKPVASKETAITFKPVISNEITVTTKPVASIETAIITKPVAYKETTVTTKPVASKETAITFKPVISNEITVTTKPVASIETAIITKPFVYKETTVTTKPVSSKETAITFKPETAVTIKPVASKETAVTIKTVASKETAVTIKPVASKETAVTIKPVASKETAVTIKTVASKETAVTIKTVASKETAVTIKPVASKETAVTINPVASNETSVTIKSVASKETAVTIKPVASKETAVTINPVASKETAITIKPVPTCETFVSSKLVPPYELSLRPRNLSSSTRMSLITSVLICFAASILAFPAKQKEDLELAKNVKTSEASAATGRIIRPVPKPFVYLKKKIEMDPDITLNQTKRDAVQESQIRVWKNTNLTYRIVNFTPDLPKADVVSAIKRAFKIWSDVTPLTFKRVPKGISDIEIEFVTGDHKDNSPFNDTDEQLAHAFGPGPDIGGNIHINDANNFTTTNQRYNLFLMVAHEIGHSLGLSHSGTYGDLMYGEYQNTDASDFLLPQNDINAIQLLYGPSPERTVQLTGPTTPSICDNNTVIDAVTTLRQDLFYFTQRFVLRKVSEMEQVELEFIQTFWPFLPNDVDAAYENPYMDSVIVFKGTKFWSFSELNVQKEGSIYEFGFPKSVKSIHAAAYVQDKDKTYFFVNDKYWRYDEDTQVMDKGFPRNIEDDFPGIQPRINGAVFYKGGLHLFKDHLQYEFCLDTRRIKQVTSITSWMGCK